MEKIYSSTPINRTAKNVISKGIHYESGKLSKKHWDSPKEIKDTSKINNINFEDLTGKKFGKFIVFGKLKKRKSSISPAPWLLKCNCGKYVGKYAYFIKKNLENEFACCDECQDLILLKRNHEKICYGKIHTAIPKKFKEIIGKKFGNFKVISIDERSLNNLNSDIYQIIYLVSCICGNRLNKSLRSLVKQSIRPDVFCDECNELSYIYRQCFFEDCQFYPDSDEDTKLIADMVIADRCKITKKEL